MSDRPKAPEYVLEQYGFYNQHQWRQMKRWQLDAILRAIKDFRHGCAYVPNYRELSDAFDVIREAREHMATRTWGK